MRDRRLLNLFDSVLTEMYRRTVRNCGGETWEANGVVCWATSLRQGWPAYANGAMRTNWLISPREVLRIVVRFFGVRKHGYSLMVRADDRALWHEAERTGQVVSAEYFAMMLAEKPDAPDCPDGVEIRVVRKASDMLDLCGVVTAGPDPEGNTRRLANLALRRIQALVGPATSALVAYHHGKPAACALTNRLEGVAFVGWIRTKPEYRGQGLASLVSASAVRAGWEGGATMAGVLSPPSTRSTLESLGFEEVGTYRQYLVMPPSD